MSKEREEPENNKKSKIFQMLSPIKDKYNLTNPSQQNNINQTTQQNNDKVSFGEYLKARYEMKLSQQQSDKIINNANTKKNMNPQIMMMSPSKLPNKVTSMQLNNNNNNINQMTPNKQYLFNKQSSIDVSIKQQQQQQQCQFTLKNMIQNNQSNPQSSQIITISQINMNRQSSLKNTNKSLHQIQQDYDEQQQFQQEMKNKLSHQQWTSTLELSNLRSNGCSYFSENVSKCVSPTKLRISMPLIEEIHHLNQIEKNQKNQNLVSSGQSEQIKQIKDLNRINQKLEKMKKYTQQNHHNNNNIYSIPSRQFINSSVSCTSIQNKFNQGISDLKKDKNNNGIQLQQQQNSFIQEESFYSNFQLASKNPSFDDIHQNNQLIGIDDQVKLIQKSNNNFEKGKEQQQFDKQYFFTTKYKKLNQQDNNKYQLNNIETSKTDQNQYNNFNSQKNLHNRNDYESINNNNMNEPISLKNIEPLNNKSEKLIQDNNNQEQYQQTKELLLNKHQFSNSMGDIQDIYQQQQQQNQEDDFKDIKNKHYFNVQSNKNILSYPITFYDKNTQNDSFDIIKEDFQPNYTSNQSKNNNNNHYNPYQYSQTNHHSSQILYKSKTNFINTPNKYNNNSNMNTPQLQNSPISSPQIDSQKNIFKLQLKTQSPTNNNNKKEQLITHIFDKNQKNQNKQGINGLFQNVNLNSPNQIQHININNNVSNKNNKQLKIPLLQLTQQSQSQQQFQQPLIQSGQYHMPLISPKISPILGNLSSSSSSYNNNLLLQQSFQQQQQQQNNQNNIQRSHSIHQNNNNNNNNNQLQQLSLDQSNSNPNTPQNQNSTQSSFILPNKIRTRQLSSIEFTQNGGYHNSQGLLNQILKKNIKQFTNQKQQQQQQQQQQQNTSSSNSPISQLSNSYQQSANIIGNIGTPIRSQQKKKTKFHSNQINNNNNNNNDLTILKSNVTNNIFVQIRKENENEMNNSKDNESLSPRSNQSFNQKQELLQQPKQKKSKRVSASLITNQLRFTIDDLCQGLESYLLKDIDLMKEIKQTEIESSTFCFYLTKYLQISQYDVHNNLKQKDKLVLFKINSSIFEKLKIILTKKMNDMNLEYSIIDKILKIFESSKSNILASNVFEEIGGKNQLRTIISSIVKDIKDNTNIPILNQFNDQKALIDNATMFFQYLFQSDYENVSIYCEKFLENKFSITLIEFFLFKNFTYNSLIQHETLRKEVILRIIEKFEQIRCDLLPNYEDNITFYPESRIQSLLFDLSIRSNSIHKFIKPLKNRNNNNNNNNILEQQYDPYSYFLKQQVKYLILNPRLRKMGRVIESNLKQKEDFQITSQCFLDILKKQKSVRFSQNQLLNIEIRIIKVSILIGLEEDYFGLFQNINEIQINLEEEIESYFQSNSSKLKIQDFKKSFDTKFLIFMIQLIFNQYSVFNAYDVSIAKKFYSLTNEIISTQISSLENLLIKKKSLNVQLIQKSSKITQFISILKKVLLNNSTNNNNNNV